MREIFTFMRIGEFAHLIGPMLPLRSSSPSNPIAQFQKKKLPHEIMKNLLLQQILN